MKVSEAAERYGISKQAIHKRLRNSGKNGLIDEFSKELTEEGEAFLLKAYGWKLKENTVNPEQPEEAGKENQSKQEEPSPDDQKRPQEPLQATDEEEPAQTAAEPHEPSEEPQTITELKIRLAVSEERAHGLEEQLSAAKEEIQHLREALSREQQLSAMNAGSLLRALPAPQERRGIGRRIADLFTGRNKKDAAEL